MLKRVEDYLIYILSIGPNEKKNIYGKGTRALRSDLNKIIIIESESIKDIPLYQKAGTRVSIISQIFFENKFFTPVLHRWCKKFILLSFFIELEIC